MKRLIATFACALAVVACAGPGSTSQPSSGASPTSSSATGAAGSPQAAAITEQDFKILPATLTVSSDVQFDVHSTGPTPHNFNVRDAAGKVVLSTKDLRTGESDSVSGQLGPGTYTFFCAFPGHESLGMHGTLTVSGS